MELRGLPTGGQFRPVPLVTVTLLLAQLLRGVAAERCAGVVCENICDLSGSQYAPQRCDDCCSNQDSNLQGSGDGSDNTKRMVVMEAAISELRVMVGVLLALVVLLLLAVVALLLRFTSVKTLKVALPVFFRSKDEGRASIEKRPPPPNKVPNENRNSTVVRIADYQNNHSPLNRRMRPNGQAVHEHSMAEHDHQSCSELPRGRLPSESTCPDESTDLPHTHHHAYDNLALSTSTLHDTTASSTSTLGPAVSTNTLDTTLPSVHPTTPVLRSVST